MEGNKLFIISGASGVGKSTVLGHVMQARKDLCFSVSATTRDPRPGETDGVEYTFVTRETFEDMIRADAFLEYDAHMKNFYGTPRAQLEEKLENAHVILDVEPKGALQVRQQRPDAWLIFIAPPSMEELERRLRKRGDTTEEQIRLRLERATWEMTQSAQYDIVVINDEEQTCAAEILNFIAEKVDM